MSSSTTRTVMEKIYKMKSETNLKCQHQYKYLSHDHTIQSYSDRMSKINAIAIIVTVLDDMNVCRVIRSSSVLLDIVM